MRTKQITKDLLLLREKSPLVHNITNYVVMNNTANALLAIGASPVMAHAEQEVEDMTSIAGALVINMGTLSSSWVSAMVMAGKRANEMGVPVVFDPVGVGATAYRTEVAQQIIDVCKPQIIRGNASEIRALLNSNAQTKGVDSVDSSESAIDAAKELAQQTGSVVVISGPTDYITDGSEVDSIKNGSVMMTKVTGMGCTATAMIGAFVAVNPNCFDAAMSAMAVMGIAGQLAAQNSRGSGSLQLNFIDELYLMSPETVEEIFLK